MDKIQTANAEFQWYRQRWPVSQFHPTNTTLPVEIMHTFAALDFSTSSIYVIKGGSPPLQQMNDLAMSPNMHTDKANLILTRDVTNKRRPVRNNEEQPRARWGWPTTLKVMNDHNQQDKHNWAPHRTKLLKGWLEFDKVHNDSQHEGDRHSLWSLGTGVECQALSSKIKPVKHATSW